MSKITYTNKVDLYEDTSIADINNTGNDNDFNTINIITNIIPIET